MVAVNTPAWTLREAMSVSVMRAMNWEKISIHAKVLAY